MDNDFSIISYEFQNSLQPDVIEKIKQVAFENSMSKYTDNVLDVLSGFAPIFNFFKTKTSVRTYKNWKIEEKVYEFLTEFSKKSYNSEELNHMAEEILKLNKETLFESMIDTLERIDNHNKARMLANILHHSISGEISRDNFLRHSWILSNVPYIDLQQLPKYTNDYYQPASSEILVSNGLIRETILDPGTYDSRNEGGSKYGLSSLGEEMLRFGFYDQYWQYKGNGRQVQGMLRYKPIDENLYGDL